MYNVVHCQGPAMLFCSTFRLLLAIFSVPNFAEYIDSNNILVAEDINSENNASNIFGAKNISSMIFGAEKG